MRRILGACGGVCHATCWLPVTACLLFCSPASADTSAVDGTAIPEDALVGRVVIVRENIFNLDDPAEDHWLYRWANRFHVLTRESTVRQQLLFREGDVFDPRLLAESERILRNNKYFYDVWLKPRANDDGTVDVEVKTRDVWTITPEITITRKGGETKTIFGFEESNLLGRGHRILLTRTDDVDREATTFEYSDRHLGGSWATLGLELSENSDGHSRQLNIAKPFHALDARWSAGASIFDDERRTAIYSLGDEIAEYRQDSNYFSVYGGWSRGLRNGWVKRYVAGVVSDDSRFSTALNPTLPAVIPDNRKLVYPYVAIEILEDRFEKTSNSDQIDRSEDFYLGTRFFALLGQSATGLGADRNALVYSAAASRGFGSLTDRALLLSATLNGRDERGSSANVLSRVNARYYWRQSDKRLFFALIDASAGHALDIDNRVELGGNSGLRGYPIRYQTGDSHLLLSVEQRYFTDWYPFRLLRVGGAVFFDVGRSWGENPAGGENLGWLRNVGFGLRFAPTRLGTRKIIHLDFAFPLDGDPTLDTVQIQFEAKRSF